MAIAQRLLVTSMSREAGARRRTSTAAGMVLLWLALGSLSASDSNPRPPGSGGRTNVSLLELQWQRLFTRPRPGRLHPGEREQRRWESDYLLGIKRVRRLYCNVGIGFHLQVRPDGSVNGVHRENLHSLIEISTVDRGVVSLFGVQSRRFVAMNRRGRLYGTAVFHRECMFKESLLANNYNAYESVSHPTSYIALTKHGRVKRGNRATTAMTVTHFLPRI
ncbi:fibroblast growth factor 6a [Gadus morhua]|uniref:Fibroblast growth factor n=1 Tax=Gadus morhua TaxID=8049 RepID=A0A8C4ZPH4_GADMO|nr:fibroblast growth factor 4B-like [Gadus morhua]